MYAIIYKNQNGYQFIVGTSTMDCLQKVEVYKTFAELNVQTPNTDDETITLFNELMATSGESVHRANIDTTDERVKNVQQLLQKIWTIKTDENYNLLVDIANYIATTIPHKREIEQIISYEPSLYQSHRIMRMMPLTQSTAEIESILNKGICFPDQFEGMTQEEINKITNDLNAGLPEHLWTKS